MSLQYKLVNWNKHKKVYDLVLAGLCAAYLIVFVAAGIALAGRADQQIVFSLLIAATGTLAFLLLHVVLSIGPLHRLSDRFAPLLYNRRHLGVTLFLAALLHGVLVTFWYGAFGTASEGFALRAVLAQGPIFPLFGFAALLVFFVMAATSHDFWLANLGPRVWKAMHMGVYAAYALVVAHVAFGPLRDLATEGRLVAWPGGLLGLAVAVGVVWVAGLHLFAAWREHRRPAVVADGSPWVAVGTVDEIPDQRAKVVCLKGAERVAVFRDGDAVSAISNVCAHQAGPLGEGKIVDGCVTCPWHGYQYDARTGQSPPPYTEKIPTYDIRLEGRTIMLNTEPNPPGTPTEPARVRPSAARAQGGGDA